jgi:hypothetical protein
MRKIKDNLVLYVIIALLIERIIWYAIALLKLYSWLNFIVEQVLALSR